MVEAAQRLAIMNVAVMLEANRNVHWEARGWTLVPAFLNGDDLTMLRREADRLLDNGALFEQRGSVPNSTTRSDRLDPVIDVSPPFAALARDQRLLRTVGDLLGGAAQLLKDKFIAKSPGVDGYGTHQDAAYWPGLGIDPHRFLTAILFLDDSTPLKGAIECAPGHHGKLLTDPNVIADPDEAALGAFETVEANAGDLLLVHALTPHRSGPNRSGEMRRTILFTYGVDARDDLYAVYQRYQMGLRR